MASFTATLRKRYQLLATAKGADLRAIRNQVSNAEGTGVYYAKTAKERKASAVGKSKQGKQSVNACVREMQDVRFKVKQR